MADISCPLCGATSLRMIESTEPPYTVYACKVCDLGFVAPMPSIEALSRAYDAAYYEPWSEQHVAARKRMWQHRVGLLQREKGSGDLLDVGGGDGAFIEAAVRVGYTVSATEFSDAGAEAMRGRAPQASVHVGELVSMGLKEASFDIITAWHSLEHMRDPFAAMAEIRRLLRPDGVAFIAVPNRNNYPMAMLYRLLKGRPYPLFSMQTREIHLFHFTPKSLRLALERAGLHVERIGWDHSMVEPAKRVIDAVAALPGIFGSPLMTEAMLAVVRPVGGES